MGQIKTYIALFEENGKGGYGVSFPDFPGCITVGDNYEEAERMAREALNFHIEGLAENGDAIPTPRTLEEIKKTWEDWPEWESDADFLITPISIFTAPDTAVKMTITLPASLVEKIDKVAKKRSGFIAEAVRAYL